MLCFSGNDDREVAPIDRGLFYCSGKNFNTVSGTPLEKLNKLLNCRENFYTQSKSIGLFYLRIKTIFRKVLVFVSNKRSADRLFEA